jgi:hypothetical protein
MNSKNEQFKMSATRELWMTQFDNRWTALFNYDLRENVSASKCAVSPYKKREITFDSDICLHLSGGMVAMRPLVFVQTSRHGGQLE